MSQPTPVRRLPLQGAPNTRDLGGYPCLGGVTRWGKFLRSANPSTLTADDVQTLVAYGLTTAVDLRSDSEMARQPSALQNVDGVEYFSVPLLDQIHSVNFEGDLPGSMAGLYISLLDKNAADFARIFITLAQAPGCALFNCSAGKDRTGVVAMLLLQLAGVPDADIEADYAVTEIYMRDVFVGQLESMKGMDVPAFVLQSRPESMRRVLRHLHEGWGGAAEYLLAAGLPAKHLDTLREKLVERG